METKQHAIKKQWVNEESKDEIRKYLRTNKNKNSFSRSWYAAEVNVRGKFIPVETRKISNYISSKGIRKRRKTKPKVIRRKEIIKARIENNKI